MSQKVFNIDLAPSIKASDLFSIDPRQIRINAEFNGRHELPPIDDLLDEFPKIGQLLPVLITKDDDGAPVLLDGHRRWRAAIELTKQNKGVHDGVFKLSCRYFKGSPVECFIATVKANHSRAGSLPIDDGYNVSRLRNRFEMSYEDIAVKVYGRTLADGSPDVKWVKEREALSELASEAAEAVAGGKVKPNAVLELAKLSKTAQRALLKASDGKITAAVVRRAAAPSVNGTGHQDTSETSEPRSAPRKWDKTAFLKLIDDYLEMNLPQRIKGLTCENAIRVILGEIRDEVAGPKR